MLKLSTICRGILRSFEHDWACDLQPRMLIGSETVPLVDRADALKATVEAVSFVTYNPFTIAQNQTLPQLVDGQNATLTHPRVPANQTRPPSRYSEGRRRASARPPRAPRSSLA